MTRSLLGSLAVFLLAVAGCRSDRADAGSAAILAVDAAAASASPGSVLPGPLPSASVAAATARAPAPSLEEVKHLVCAARQPCDVARVRSAGTDASGRPLLVATVDLGLRNADDLAGGSTLSDAGAGLESDGSTDTTQPLSSAAGACHAYEHWLIAGDGAHSQVQLLHESCNDGYGAAGVGEDSITVGDRQVTIAQVGGSNWRWSDSWDIAFDPLHVRAQDIQGYWTVGSNTSDEHWSWDDFEGIVRWSSPTCDDSGDIPDDTQGPDFDQPRFAYRPIPAVDIEPAFTGGGWRTTALGRCSLRADASGAGGFVTHGALGAAGDASLRVVASSGGRVLFVEVRDDVLVGPSARWVDDDHLELWIAPQQRSFSDQCLPARDEAPAKQWGIRLTDGKVFAGAGHPSPGALKVERAEEGGAVRFRLALPGEVGAITVVYSDSDDGQVQKRLIATSALRFGESATLGAFEFVPSRRAVCRVRAGALEPELRAPQSLRPRRSLTNDGARSGE